MTGAELILWSRIRRRTIAGQRFRRQHPIGPYIVDFVCLSARFAIELDGETHATDAEVAYDARRDALLRRCGFRVMRLWNCEIYENLEGVLEKIWAAVVSEPGEK